MARNAFKSGRRAALREHIALVKAPLRGAKLANKDSSVKMPQGCVGVTYATQFVDSSEQLSGTWKAWDGSLPLAGNSKGGRGRACDTRGDTLRMWTGSEQRILLI